MVLIFSTDFEYSTAYVIKWLNHLGIKTLRINGNDDIYKFTRITKDGIYFRNSITNEEVNIEGAKACWWRRTGITAKNLTTLSKESLIVDNLDLTQLIKGKKNYIDDEAKALIQYIFYRVYETSTINLGKPFSKLNRLIVFDIAKKMGLQVPDYEVIKNGAQFLNSSNRFGKIVTKAISDGIYDEIQDRRFYTYTELAKKDFLYEKESTFFPSLIAELIEKEIEIRTFFIADVFYSMAIFSQTDEKTKIDFRKYSNNRTEPYKLPEEIEIKLGNVFKELNLNCGSADFIIDKEGNYIFLEINPVGQFAMTSEPCNYNLHKIVANYLIYGRD